MASNAELEMRWVAAWNDVYDIVRGQRATPCLLPDGSMVDVDTCLGWLQDSAYQNYLLTVAECWVGNQRCVAVTRVPDPESAPPEAGSPRSAPKTPRRG